MAQPQHQAPPPRAFSPAQHSPSPAASQSAFALPPNKRPRTDGAPSQPDSPYAGSPYAASPVAVATPPTTNASPTYPQGANTPTAYSTPYTNGHVTPGLNLPNTQAVGTPPLHAPQLPQQPQQQYTAATMAPLPHAATPAQAAGVMGPPQRPADRATKDYQYDPMDSLAGTGIDLSAEEKYMSELYATSFDTEARTGFPQHQPASKGSFYGAGQANQGAEALAETEQEKVARDAAEKAWSESAMRLAVARTQEVKDPFLLVALLHRRADKIAREHSIGLNLEYKNNVPSMGKMKVPEQAQPKVIVTTKLGPDSTATVHTTGSFIPHDAYLVDQLALLSIASKHRVRELLEDVSLVATTRQKTSHGEVPEDWAVAAAPSNRDPIGDTVDGNAAVESAPSPGTNPLKRLANGAMPNGTSASKLPKIASFMTATMREQAKKEREWEEARLRMRQKRKDGITDGGPSASRANSVAPATPGSVAPEPEKALTKKEMKKNQQMKAAEAHSHANQNMTSSMFAGLGGRSGLFGKKKSGKSYDWMNVGRGGSGTSTPSKGGGGGKGLGAVPGSPAPGNMAMTTEGRNRLGTWREDKEKGKKIQLRDWVTVLERDGREAKALQRAYLALDLSDPR
ncbi:hypothetical protein CC79DRAFT_1275060 [Sarocladium strictum]